MHESDCVSIHLVVLQHGLGGRPANLQYLHGRLQNARTCSHISTKFLISTVNVGLTMDGIDVCGERLVQQLREHIQLLESGGDCRVTHISFLGYSMGGMITRYAVGVLELARDFKPGGLIPVNFITVATPHLGVFKSKPGLFRKLFNFFFPKMASWSGHQLMLMDCHAFGKPLLCNMADPKSKFLQGLQRFQNLMLVSNIHFDYGVPYWTSSISLLDPYAKHQTYLGYSKSMPKHDSPSHPSIRRPCTEVEAMIFDDEEEKKLPLMAGGMHLGFIFLTLLFLFPLMCVVLLTWTILASFHYQSLKNKRPDHSWISEENASHINEDDGHQSVSLNKQDICSQNEDLTDDPRRAVLSEPHVHVRAGGSMATILEQQRYMERSLNELPWQRVDVDCRHYLAHDGIVVTSTGFLLRDQVEYLREQMLWP